MRKYIGEYSGHRWGEERSDPGVRQQLYLPGMVQQPQVI